MATASGIRAGKAYVELGVVADKLNKGLVTAQAKVDAWAAGSKKTLFSAFAVAAPVAMAVKTFAAFDDQMRLVQGVTQSTGAAFEQLTERAKELGRTTSWTAAQVAEGMISLGRAGFQTDEIDKSISSVMDLARATGAEIGMATDIASNAMRSFNLDASQMSRVCDVLTATANGSAQTIEDLGYALADVAPIAASTGLTLEDTAKLVGALANFGVKGSSAGTVLKNIQTRLASDANAQKTYLELGINTTDAEGNLRKLNDILSELGQKISSMPSAERLSTIKTLFGQYGLKGVSITAADFKELNAAIDNASGAAERTAKAMDDGIGGAMRLTASAVEGFKIALGESLVPTLTVFAEKIQDGAAWLTAYTKEHPRAITESAALTLKLGAAAAAVFTLSKAMSLAVSGVRVATSAYGSLSKVVNVFVGASKAAAAAEKAQAAASTALANVQKAVTAVNAAKTAQARAAALAELELAKAEYKGAAAASLDATAKARATASTVALTTASVAAVAVVAALVYGLNRYATAADRAADKAANAADAAARLSDENAQRREMDTSLFEQLDELAQKTSLTNEEFATAQNIVEQLQSRYGNLGVTCDATSKSILGMADAQNKFNQAKQAAVIADVENEIKKRERQLDALNRVDEKYGFSTGKTTFASGVMGARNFFGGKSWEEARVENKQQRADVVGELQALRQQLAAAQNVANAQARDASEQAQRAAAATQPQGPQPLQPVVVEQPATEAEGAPLDVDVRAAASVFDAGADALSAALAPLESFDATTSEIAAQVENYNAQQFDFEPGILAEPIANEFANLVDALDGIGASIGASFASSGTFNAFEAMESDGAAQLDETRKQTRALNDIRADIRRYYENTDDEWI